jgi:hypothetical protein
MNPDIAFAPTQDAVRAPDSLRRLPHRQPIARPRPQVLRVPPPTQCALTRPPFWRRAFAVSLVTALGTAILTLFIHFIFQLCQH